MDNSDKKFFVALAYTAATEKDLDILDFSQKVEENLKILSEKKSQQSLPKARILKNPF